MTNREPLSIEERFRLTPSEAVAIQAIADRESVSKSSLYRRGVQIIIALDRKNQVAHDDRVSTLFPIPETDVPGL